MTEYAQKSFIQVDGSQFIKDGQAYYFLGTNFWYGMHLGAPAPIGDRTRLIRELNLLDSLGVKNLRIMGACEGPDDEPWRVLPSLQAEPGKYNPQLLEGLDFLLMEMGKRDMQAVICLNNFWPWSGGMAQYLAWHGAGPIPYPPPAEGGSWSQYQLYTAKFYDNPAAVKAFEEFIRMMVKRENRLTNVRYIDDPTIMAWQLANEPRAFLHRKSFLKWVENTAQLIKSIDPNHLVSLGSEGYTSSKFAGTHFVNDHKSDNIDYATFHCWVQNWGWYDPKKHEETIDQAYKKVDKYIKKHLKKAKKIDKPIVMEEFGIARDLGDHTPSAKTKVRDQYFQTIFQTLFEYAESNEGIAGTNFWAWGGLGRPQKPKAIWKIGDDLIGDPPHEYQGWYSVYDQDQSTLSIIRTYAEKFGNLK